MFLHLYDHRPATDPEWNVMETAYSSYDIGKSILTVATPDPNGAFECFKCLYCDNIIIAELDGFIWRNGSPLCFCFGNPLPKRLGRFHVIIIPYIKEHFLE